VLQSAASLVKAPPRACLSRLIPLNRFIRTGALVDARLASSARRTASWIPVASAPSTFALLSSAVEIVLSHIIESQVNGRAAEGSVQSGPRFAACLYSSRLSVSRRRDTRDGWQAGQQAVSGYRPWNLLLPGRAPLSLRNAVCGLLTSACPELSPMAVSASYRSRIGDLAMRIQTVIAARLGPRCNVGPNLVRADARTIRPRSDDRASWESSVEGLGGISHVPPPVPGQTACHDRSGRCLMPI
jgi:hypothetical protein